MTYDEFLKQQKRLRHALGPVNSSAALIGTERFGQSTLDILGLDRATDALNTGLMASAFAIGQHRDLARLGTLRDLHQAGGALESIRLAAEGRLGSDMAALARSHAIAASRIDERLMRQVVGDGRSFGHPMGASGAAVAALAAGSGAVARAVEWARALDATTAATLSSTFRGTAAIDEQIGRLARSAAHIAHAAGSVRGILGVTDFPSAATTLKLSAFAGSLDMFGPRGDVGQVAFSALFGGWRTRPDLPGEFWRNAGTRQRMYRDAEVDDGLVDADSAQVVEVLVGSGVVEGSSTRGGVKAIVQVGPLRMSITARRARHDAFRVIDAFEVALRAFIGDRLGAHLLEAGEDADKWFTARVPGDIVGAAKRKRRAAYQAGEARQPLIDFTDLGDLIAVLTSTRNWTEVFGPVFGDRDGLKVDLQRLNGHRRPTMHARTMDGPRLAEIVLTVRRLVASMELRGPIDAGWDDDV